MAATGFPDATTTGVPAGVTLTPSGGLTINTPGAVISGLDIRGPVFINASNVTLQNCRVTSDNFYVIKVATGVTGVVIQDCDIDGVGNGNDGNIGITYVGDNGLIARNDIYNVENGVALEGSGTVIQDNYIHGLKASGSPHYDGIQIDGKASNAQILHNTIINDYTQTAAIMIDNYFGPISNIIVDNNYLAGGGYTVYSDAQFTGGTVSGVQFTDNYMVKGYWGYSAFTENTPLWQGNVDAVTGQSLGGGVGTPDTTPPGAPMIMAFSTDSGVVGDGITNDKTLMLSGTAEANSTVKLYDGVTLLGATTASGNGAWSYTTSALSDTIHNFTAKATDAANNTSVASSVKAVTVDSIAPSAPTIALSTDTGMVGDGITSDNTLSLTGAAAANSSVKVYDGAMLLGTATANGSGAWSYTTGVLSNAPHSLTATATDAAGNTSGASSALAVSVNTGTAIAGSVSINDVTISEGNNGTKEATFTVTRSGGTPAFAVNFATSDGTATAGYDYDAASGTLNFGASENTKTISVTINGDTNVEANQTFNVVLSNATNGATISDSQGVGTITNDDSASTPIFTSEADTVTLPLLGGTFNALGGDDKLAYTGGPVNINGGTESDTVDFSRFGSAVWVDLAYNDHAIWTQDRPDLSSDSWRAIGDVTNVENLVGTDYSDFLQGDIRANILQGGDGNDTLTGGGRADTFVFDHLGAGSQHQRDIIVDFQPGVDRIDLAATSVSDFTDLFTVGDRYMEQVGNDVLIHTSVSADTSILLQNLQLASLTQYDFLF